MLVVIYPGSQKKRIEALMTELFSIVPGIFDLSVPEVYRSTGPPEDPYSSSPNGDWYIALGRAEAKQMLYGQAHIIAVRSKEVIIITSKASVDESGNLTELDNLRLLPSILRKLGFMKADEPINIESEQRIRDLIRRWGEQEAEALTKEEEAIARRQAEERQRADAQRMITLRKADGDCIMCGKRLGWFARFRGADRHDECTNFVK
jgi:hypothetical protein